MQTQATQGDGYAAEYKLDLGSGIVGVLEHKINNLGPRFLLFWAKMHAGCTSGAG
jgi:hypothetical protein